MGTGDGTRSKISVLYSLILSGSKVTLNGVSGEKINLFSNVSTKKKTELPTV